MVAHVQNNRVNISKENQYFSTFDVLSVVFSLAVVVSISFTVFHRTIDRKKVDAAKINMENLAQELMSEPVIYTQNPGGRIPASASQMSTDPWGIEYTYKVIKNSYGQPIYLVVLSAGPDSKLDTELKEEALFDVSQIENIKFENDDVGYIKSFR